MDEKMGSELLPEYRKTAYKIGVFTAILFFLRIPAGFAISALYFFGADALSPDVLYICRLLISLFFLQILPSVISAAMFGFLGKSGRLKALYRVPKSCMKAIANFPAVYGLGQAVNVITIVITALVTSGSSLETTQNPIAQLTAPSMGTAWFLFVFAAVIAPVFEELVFRGTLMQALKPYGNGLAILYTGILFGLYHGNLSQCFYTMAIGIALGYIANITNSLVPTTVIHICINSISSGVLLFLSSSSVQRFLLSEAISDADQFVIIMFVIFAISALLFGLVGFILAVVKLRKIRRYRIPKVWDEIGNGKKVKLLLCSVPAVIAFLLLLDTYLGFSSAGIAMLINRQT